jgi:aminopeptidase N
MYATLLGKDGFRRGMDLYFERHDGQAVTCDDFRAAMADANKRDLAQFERWYLQAGTPRLAVTVARDGDALVVGFEQRAPRNQPSGFEPMLVPVRFAIIGRDGRRVPLVCPQVAKGATEAVLELTTLRQSFRFTGVPQGAVPSILRDFSAPVVLEYEQSDAELAFLFGKDDDDFNRWDAGQRLFGNLILGAARRTADAVPTALHLEAFGAVLADARIDGAMKAALLVLPGETTLAQSMDVIDPDALHRARVSLRKALATAHHATIAKLYEATRPRGAFRLDQAEVQRRDLNGVLLAYLTATERPETAALAWKHFESADNMTDQQNALGCLAEMDVPERERALAAFHARWHTDPLVLDKWFMTQAVSQAPGAVARVRALVKRPDFSLENPNRARSVVHAFAANNPTGFHDASGDGYRFVADHVLAIGAFNPQVASRLAKSFNQWRRYDPARQALMKAQLERIAATPGLSKDVFEIVKTALA